MLNSLIGQQKFICEKANSDFYPLDSNTMVAIALDTIGQMPIYGLRYPLVESNNIGWFIYCGEYCEDADFFKPVHISHLEEILPQVLPYLALQENFAFVIDNEGYEDIYQFQ